MKAYAIVHDGDVMVRTIGINAVLMVFPTKEFAEKELKFIATERPELKVSVEEITITLPTKKED